MGERLLIVEDDKNQQFLYEQELREEGYDISVASNADEALALIQKKSFNLVILDICMPGKDGIETLSEIMEYDNKIPVILNTAYGTYKDNFMTWSADAYVVKSSDLTELKTTIRSILDQKNVGA
ncbi:MAG: response regulator [Candidatus Auribacterota bacterium]|jgi:DNA-binding NtrC family response regulator|uniref:Response regulator n=1 Tax=Candidatus Auribacter fodinae TaxID=2093366 RepID=A0A3A4R7K6_9BACT|nr:MAG: response regulator [Candidatus Auribacter fodinae]